MRISQLQERTAYHDNPRYNAVQQLKMMTKTASGNNKFISFTKIPKLGLNPVNEHSTPIGIYVYPLDYVVRVIGGGDDFSDIPYASDRPYIYLIELTESAKLLNITSKTNVSNDVTKLHEYLVQNGHTDLIDSLNFNKVQTPQLLWYCVIKLSKYLAEIKSGTSTTIASVLFFKVLGYDGVIDEGSSTIHVNEPTQAVIFNPKAIKKYNLIDNNLADHKKNTIQIKYDNSRVVHAVTPEEALRQSSGKSDVKRYDFDSTTLSVVNRDGKIIITCYNGQDTTQLLTKVEWLHNGYVRKCMVRGTGIVGVKEHPKSGTIKELLDSTNTLSHKPDVPNLFGVPIKTETGRLGNKLINTYNNIGPYTILIKPDTTVQYTVKVKHKDSNVVATFEIMRYHGPNEDTFSLEGYQVGNHTSQADSTISTFDELIRLYKEFQ